MFATLVGAAFELAKQWTLDSSGDDKHHDPKSHASRVEAHVARIVGLPIVKRTEDKRRYLMAAFEAHCKLVLKNCMQKLQVFERSAQIALQLSCLPKIGGGSAMILSGSPGSGKSTQIPKIMAEYGIVLPMPGRRLLVVEPRATVAAALAERVSIEWNGAAVPGGAIGLAIRSRDTFLWDSEETAVIFVDEDTAMEIVCSWH